MKLGNVIFKKDATKKTITPQIQNLINNTSFWAIGKIDKLNKTIRSIKNRIGIQFLTKFKKSQQRQ